MGAAHTFLRALGLAGGPPLGLGEEAPDAPTPDAAPAIFASEFEGLMSLVAQNVSVEIRMSEDVAFLRSRGWCSSSPRTRQEGRCDRRQAEPGERQVMPVDDVSGDGGLKLYSLYAPPKHPDGTVHRTKADAADHG